MAWRSFRILKSARATACGNRRWVRWNSSIARHSRHIRFSYSALYSPLPILHAYSRDLRRRFFPSVSDYRLPQGTAFLPRHTLFFPSTGGRVSISSNDRRTRVFFKMPRREELSRNFAVSSIDAVEKHRCTILTDDNRYAFSVTT